MLDAFYVAIIKHRQFTNDRCGLQLQEEVPGNHIAGI